MPLGRWNSLNPTAQRWWQELRDPVTGCVWAALGYLPAAAITDIFVLSAGVSDSAWEHPGLFEAYGLPWAALILSLSVLVLAMRAMAPEDATDSSAS
jgi:hypothetical protein